MSEQNPIPPNPNESTPPPPVVNPPSSRSDKNLKTKKTTRTMNPKSTSTMKHHHMIDKSTDVIFKKVITWSSSKGSETAMAIEEMVDGVEADENSGGKESGDGSSSDSRRMSGIVNEEVVVKSGEAEKGNGVSDGVSGNDTNGCVSDMFPELSSNSMNKKLLIIVMLLIVYLKCLFHLIRILY